MVRLQRSARARVGKRMEARQWAMEVAEYLNKKYPQTSFQVYTELFGAFHTIYWFSDFENVAALEGLLAQLRSDEGYRAVTSKAADLVIEDSFKDTLMISA